MDNQFVGYQPIGGAQAQSPPFGAGSSATKSYGPQSPRKRAGGGGLGGARIKVAVRVRPLLPPEEA